MNNKQQSPISVLLVIIGIALIGLGVLAFLPALFGWSIFSFFRYVVPMIGPMLLIGMGAFVVYLASTGAFSRRTPTTKSQQDQQFSVPPRGTQLYRSTDDKIVAGVCGGLADYFGADPALVRIAAAVIMLFWGFGVIAYIIAWLIIPPAR